MGKPAYQEELSTGFMAMADVHLSVGDKTYHAHSQCLAAASSLLERALQDIKPMPTAKQPWVIKSLREGYDSKMVEWFLGAVYSPPVNYEAETAWEMLEHPLAFKVVCKIKSQSETQ